MTGSQTSMPRGNGPTEATPDPIARTAEPGAARMASIRASRELRDLDSESR